jgi:hypothetical protein
MEAAEQTPLESSGRVDKKPNQKKPNQKKPNQKKPNQKKPNQKKPKEGIPWICLKLLSTIPCGENQGHS